MLGLRPNEIFLIAGMLVVVVGSVYFGVRLATQHERKRRA